MGREQVDCIVECVRVPGKPGLAALARYCESPNYNMAMAAPARRVRKAVPMAFPWSRRGAVFAALSFFLAGCAETGLVTTDTSREKKMASEVVSGLVVGEPVYLETPMRVRTIGREKFLSIYTLAPNPNGAVILCHGAGLHPDAGIVGKLRDDLAARGYTTLSIQMPMVGPDIVGRATTAEIERKNYPLLFEDGGERIAAAAKFLQSKGYARVAIVSHGMGSRMAEFYLIHFAEAPVFAWVSLSISNGEFSQVGRLALPVLDLYAENDQADVVTGAPFRAAVLRSSPRGRQLKVPGTDHVYTGKDRQVAAEIQRFLDALSRS